MMLFLRSMCRGGSSKQFGLGHASRIPAVAISSMVLLFRDHEMLS